MSKIDVLKHTTTVSEWQLTRNVPTDNLFCEVQDGSSSWSMGGWGQIEIAPSSYGQTQPRSSPYDALQGAANSLKVHHIFK